MPNQLSNRCKVWTTILISVVMIFLLEINFQFSPTLNFKPHQKWTAFLSEIQRHLLSEQEPKQDDIVYNSSKRILLYNPKHWESKMYTYFNDFWETCPKSCEITTNRSLFKESDAVVFVLDVLPSVNLPPKQKGQVWIFSEFESTDYLEKELKIGIMRADIFKRLNNKVNWTWTYRRDSDFPFVHGSYSTRKFRKGELLEEHYINIIKSKTKSAVAFVSHCGTISKREIYTKELKKYINIDIYGHCGNRLNIKDCPRQRVQALLQAWGLQKHNKSSECFNLLDKNYNFYLSFENSLCRDYITEKGLHHVVQHDVIPVMRSGVNHSIFNPPNSYVDVNQFQSAKELSDYLIYLKNHPEEMLKYYKWKQYYNSDYAIENWRQNMCNICKRLYDPDKYFRIYNDLHQWLLWPNGEASCRSGACNKC